ncbi:MAG: hypothetical protein R3337_01290 [Gammaproteobacteria bacterium]|nr:hypothetical protein [Gammaproteobacteria bacterium]
MRDNGHRPRGVYALAEERDALVRKLDGRGQIVKALVDGDPVMIFVLTAVGTIWGVELAANLANVSGWVRWAHLGVVGVLELAVLYCLFAAVRAAALRRRIRRIDRRLRELIP